jgi:N-acetylmuramoyl-L-alanine amidase
MKRISKVRLAAMITAVGLAFSLIPALNISAAATADEDYAYAVSQEIDAGTRSIPAGASRTGVNVNGRRVLEGRVFVLDGITYVPMFKFADWLGVFTYSSTTSGSVRSSRINGENLQIQATENKLYIIANGRYFYTVGKVMEIDGEIYVPITPLVKALNCHVNWSNDQNRYVVRSGDTRMLKSAEQTYADDAVYWLSRIINAEAGGESMQGKIAVGNVVLNRTRSSQFPNTIYGVIFDKKYGVQFAPTANGMIYKTPNADSIIAAKICLEGYSVSNQALYFFNPKYTSGAWVKNNRDYLFTIGNHVFYN